MDVISKMNVAYNLLKMRSIAKKGQEAGVIRVSGVLDEAYCFQLPASTFYELDLASLEVSTFSELVSRLICEAEPTQEDITDYDYAIFEQDGHTNADGRSHVHVMCNAETHEVGQNIVVDYNTRS